MEAIRFRCQTFAGFVKEAWHVLEPAKALEWSWHLQVMCDHLQAVTEERIPPSGIINVSPGSSKSTIVTVMWQAWEWGPAGKPSSRFLTSSFEEGNVVRDTRKTRDLVLSEWYRTLWPEVLEANGKLVRAGETSFANRHTGTREGVAFVSLTAKRGDRVVIDDPHSLSGSESEKERETAVRLFLEGGLNRLNDQTKSSIIIVMQRLHERDLTGALLAARIGFWHLVIPMEYDPERADPTSKMYVPPTPLGWTDPRTRAGELMDPVRMPREAVEKLKGVSHYAWIGQYQQRPAAREGGLFKRSWFKRVRAVPGAVNNRGRYWDLAASEDEGSAYTAGVRVSELEGNFYVEDVKRERKSAAGVRTLIKDTAEEDKRLFGLIRIRLPQDPGQAGKDQAQGFVKMLAGHDARTKVVSGDKVTRATPASAQAEAGNVFLVETGDPVADAWIEPFLEEVAGFPSFAYKDQVDAFADAINDLALAPRATTVIGRTAFGAR